MLDGWGERGGGGVCGTHRHIRQGAVDRVLPRQSGREEGVGCVVGVGRVLPRTVGHSLPVPSMGTSTLEALGRGVAPRQDFDTFWPTLDTLKQSSIFFWGRILIEIRHTLLIQCPGIYIGNIACGSYLPFNAAASNNKGSLLREYLCYKIIIYRN